MSPGRPSGIETGVEPTPIGAARWPSTARLLLFAKASEQLTPHERAKRIRAVLNISPTAYYQALNRAIDSPEAEALAPALVARLRARRAALRAHRLAHGGPA